MTLLMIIITSSEWWLQVYCQAASSVLPYYHYSPMIIRITANIDHYRRYFWLLSSIIINSFSLEILPIFSVIIEMSCSDYEECPAWSFIGVIHDHYLFPRWLLSVSLMIIIDVIHGITIIEHLNLSFGNLQRKVLWIFISRSSNFVSCFSFSNWFLLYFIWFFLLLENCDGKCWHPMIESHLLTPLLTSWEREIVVGFGRSIVIP